MKISIIVAMDEKRGIGKNNNLLFKISEDFKRMSGLTRNHPVIMGRKTFESIGRVLPNRTSIVVTRDSQRVKNVSFYSPDVEIVTSLTDGIKVAKEIPGFEEVFIFGGGEVFKEAMEKNLVDKLYLTVVEGDFDADTFFPDYSEFKKVVFEKAGESEGYRYKFLELER
ncbi:MAG: dihydrofolate reductase [Candidatus Levybacteria bacterium]|nr:dihydrofolate reductase [Candidatus Levybacteria bacterium]MDZ4228076.1 dihydrofolate reductase [Candidatus Levybacteria bacterium]